tara:strand:+ start:333 stop:545 length:213 start_codon:yes stop_codon:yes gene_type:complete
LSLKIKKSTLNKVLYGEKMLNKIFAIIFVVVLVMSCGGGGGGSTSQNNNQSSGSGSGYNVPGSFQPVDTE